MAINKRTPLEIQRDRHRIAELYIQGKYQYEIGKILGLAQSQICYDLKAIQEEWIKNTTFALDEYKGKELAKIDQVEREAWRAWERSQEDYKARITKGKGIKKDKKTEELQAPKSVDQTTKTEYQYGDSKFLEIVLKCIKRRCEMLGIDAPEKHEHTGKDGKALFSTMKEDDIDIRLRELEIKFNKNKNDST